MEPPDRREGDKVRLCLFFRPRLGALFGGNVRGAPRLCLAGGRAHRGSISRPTGDEVRRPILDGRGDETMVGAVVVGHIGPTPLLYSV